MVVLALIMSCKSSPIAINKGKMETALEGIEATNEIIRSLGLEEPIKDILKIITTPISLTAAAFEELERDTIAKIKGEKGIDKELFDSIYESKDGEVYDILENSDKKVNLNKAIKLEDRSFYLVHLAIERGMPSMVIDKMIEKGAMLDCRNERGETPLILAIKRERVQVASSIIKRLEDNTVLGLKDKDGMTALMVAIKSKQIGIIELILEKIKENRAMLSITDTRGMTALEWSILIDDKGSVIEKLIEAGSEIDNINGENNLTPLQFASLVGNEKAVEKIVNKLEIGENEKDTKERVRKEILRKTGKGRRNALHIAAVSESADIYEYLSEKSRDEKGRINIPVDEIGATPVHYLALRQYIKLDEETKKYIKREEGDILLSESFFKNIGKNTAILDYISKQHISEISNEGVLTDSSASVDNRAMVSAPSRTDISYEDESSEEEKLKNQGEEQHPIENELEEDEFEAELEDDTAKKDQELKFSDKVKDQAAIEEEANEKNNRVEYLIHKTVTGFTPLHYAAYFGDEELFRKLIDKIGVKLFEKKNISLVSKRMLSKSNFDSLSVIDCAYLAHKIGRKAILKNIVEILPKRLGIEDDIKKNFIEDFRTISFVGNNEKFRLYLLILGFKESFKDFYKEQRNNIIHMILKDNNIEILRYIMNSNLKYTFIDWINYEGEYPKNTSYPATKILKEYTEIDSSINVKEYPNLSDIEEDNFGNFEKIYLFLVKSILDNVIKNLKYVIQKKAKIIEIMGENFYQTNESSKTLLELATERNNLIFVKLLLKEGEKIFFDRPRKTALHIAAESGFTELLEYLCQYFRSDLVELERYPLDDEGKLPIHYAIDNGHNRCIEILIYRADSKYRNCIINNDLDMIKYALNSKNTNSIDTIIKLFKDFEDYDANNIISITLLLDLFDTLIYLLRNNKEISVDKLNHQNMLGETALHIAARKGKFNLFLELMKLGADPNLFNKKSESPIMLIIKSDSNKEWSDDIRDEILKYDKIEIDQVYEEKVIRRNKKRKTLIELAIESEYESSVRFLSQRRDLSDFLFNNKDISKKILYLAVDKNNYEVVKCILAMGCYVLQFYKKEIKFNPVLSKAIKRSNTGAFRALYEFNEKLELTKISKKTKIPYNLLIYSGIESEDREHMEKMLEEVNKRLERKIKNEDDRIKYIKERVLNKKIKDPFTGKLREESINEYLQNSIVRRNEAGIFLADKLGIEAESSYSEAEESEQSQLETQFETEL